MAILYNLWQFGILCGLLYTFFGTIYQEKSGNPAFCSKNPKIILKMLQNSPNPRHHADEACVEVFIAMTKGLVGPGLPDFS
jgi:hypothetical protein